MSGQHLLPDARSLEDYRRIRGHTEVWEPAARVICERHGLDTASLELSPLGSQIVFRAGTRGYIKLYALPLSGDFVSERAVLEVLAGHPAVPVPRIAGQGDIDGWPYLILTPVEGLPLGDIWFSLDEVKKEDIARKLGRLMHALHSATGERLVPLAMDWETFVQDRARQCVAHHARAGTPDAWLVQIEEFLRDLPPLYPPEFTPRLLHADISGEHIFVSTSSGEWEITGLLDFGDAMLGYPLYDFVAPGFLFPARPRLRREWLLSYGFAESDLTEDLSTVLMAYTLLHRYGKLPDYLGSFGAHPPANLQELQKRLWSFG